MPKSSLAYTTALHAGAEVWGKVELETLAYTPAAALPVGTLQRSAMAVSPAGVLGGAVLHPGSALACFALPVPCAPIARCAGRLVALALLRHAECSDVAVWAHSHTKLASALPDILTETAHALGFARSGVSYYQTWTLARAALALLSREDEACATLVRRRLALFVELASLHTYLARARIDASTTRFSELLERDASVPFATRHAWHLAEGVQRLHALLAAAARHAVATTTEATPQADALLELLAFPEAAALFRETLAGCTLFVAYIAKAELAQYADGLGDEPATPEPVLARCKSAAAELASVRKVVRAAERDAPVDLRAAAKLFASWTPASAAWTAFFTAPAAPHASDAGRALADALLAPSAQIVRDTHSLWTCAPEILRPASLVAT